MKNRETFWITNISARNVTLADLAVTVRARSTVNLLDKKHYQYTKEQLEKSAAEGSIFKKKSMIFVRKVAPEIPGSNKIPIVRDNSFPSRERSIFIIKEDNFEELNVSDTQYAEENAELAEMDAQPLVKKG